MKTPTRIPTDEDRAALDRILDARDDRQKLDLIYAYWRDLDRAERTPRQWLYLHLGIACGIAAKAQAAPHV